MPDDVVPDVYADQMSLALTPYGIALTFSLSNSAPNPARPMQPEPKVVVRMSLEHAKSLAMIVRRQLKQYELEQLGDAIRLPRQVMQQMNLSEDDW